MFTKNINQLTYNDISEFLDVNKIKANPKLEFIGDFSGTDEAKSDLAKKVSALANTKGGFLILGVDKLNSIIGVNKFIDNIDTLEYLRHSLNETIEPQLEHLSFKSIDIPKISQKFIVVIHINQSTKKPHIVKGLNRYYIRTEGSLKSANHVQIKEMFDSSRSIEDNLSKFVATKNLFDDKSENFGQNENSINLYSDITTKLGNPAPLVIFSLFSKLTQEDEIINIPFLEFKQWMEQHSKGYEPSPGHYLFHPNNKPEMLYNGFVLKNYRNKENYSYLEILNNGCVEAGFSNSFFGVYSDQKSSPSLLNGYISLTFLIAYEMMFLGFAKDLYSFLKYDNEIVFQISLANILGYMPVALNKKYRSGWHGSAPTNRRYTNLKLTHSFNPSNLTEEEIYKIAKNDSEKINRAFGLEQDYCFVNDQLSTDEMIHSFYI